METVAIATAKSVLNSVVKTATTAITNEIGLLLGVEDELFFIKEELQMMRAFLRAAKTENVKCEIVTTWIQQVQELAFDVEDCLQEASIDLLKKRCLPIMCSMKKHHHIAQKIRVLKTRIEDVSKRNLRYNLISKENGSYTSDESASTRLIANVDVFLVGLDEPKRKLIELILKEHGEVISVVGMGGLGKTTLVREVYGCQELKDKFNCFAWVTIQHPFITEEFTESLAKQICSIPQEDDNKRGQKPELLPKETIKEKVIKYLNDQKYLIVLDDLSSLSEWDRIKDVLPQVIGSRIIVTTRYRRPLAESISHTSNNIYEIKELSEKDAIDLFCKVVYKTPNYRLVSEKVYNRNEIMEEDSKARKKCIINSITKGEDRDIRDDPPYKTKRNINDGPSNTEITEENSKIQKQCITNSITEDMETQAGLIIKSCGRLPLAIVTIGSYLATKPKTSAEWKKMHDHLSSELANNPDLGVVKTVLTSSYDGLPHHLKPSLLYLSVFHNHKEIRRSRIIRRWMADGYVVDGRKKMAEEVGNVYFYDLMGRGFIQPSQTSTISHGNFKRCNIHDMMYELILTKAVDESMVSVLDDENLITMTDKVRHLVIMGGPCTGGQVLERVKLSHMRSVSIFGEVGDYLRYPGMKLVRVLDLEGTLDLKNRDLRSIGKLHYLKFLGLRGTKIRELPDSLGKLSELETLDIRNTAVIRLPIGVTKLKKLSYLRAGFDHYNNPDINIMGIADNIILGCLRYLIQVLTSDDLIGLLLAAVIADFVINKCCFLFLSGDASRKNFGSLGVRAPQGIYELRSLNILGMIDIGRSKGIAKKMQTLTNLRKLAVTGFSQENGKMLAKVIDGLKHLRSLVLSAANDSGLECCLGSVSSPPKYLQSLKLYSPLGKLPDFISSLENLEKIHFRNTKLMGGIKAIEKLPNLKILYLLERSTEEMKELCFGEGTFPMLQIMVLVEICGVESVSIEKTALKRLEQLKISHCCCIGKGGVSGLDSLVQLKEMELVMFHNESESNNEFVSNLQEKLSMHPNKPILRVTKK